MAGGGRDAPPPPVNGGEFLLSLLQKPQSHTSPHMQQSQQLLGIDPAVAAVGPSLHFLQTTPSHPPPWTNSPPSNNIRDISHHHHLWAHNTSSPPTPIPPHHLFGMPPPQNHRWNIPINNNNHPLANENNTQQQLHMLGFSNPGPSGRGHGQEPLVFGTLSANWQQLNHPAAANKEREIGGLSNGNRQPLVNNRSAATENRTTMMMQPPRRNEEEDGAASRQNGRQLEHPAMEIEESMTELHNEEEEEDEDEDDADNVDDLGQRNVDSLLLDPEADGNKDKKHHRDKDVRHDQRGQNVLNQRMRFLQRQMQCRIDIDRQNTSFLAIYESLIPPEEEKAKQIRLLALLEKLVTQEWPDARLYLYGSCANSFGVSKSDIDVCLAFQEGPADKSEVLLKLAAILESDNLQNVQALTRARVPIVKLMHPETGISCDICINNVLAVVNTKLLRDYAQIDGRLRQLAYIVKHWAKSRGVNATYQGTLSSYAYVLMCIHFLQQRRPAILPCLQEMEPTYAVTVDNIKCAYYDRVERLGNYGSRNRDTIARLVWGFFNYWAYRHDYANSVISVRTGGIISKREKDWTRRIGNDRHLICIEDPFEVTHDLGRVVDKFSIKVLREEFERAAEIMQYDPNPCVTLFEQYVPIS